MIKSRWLSIELITIQDINKQYTKKYYIDKTYQRKLVWKNKQKQDLIWSIQEDYSIGALTLYLKNNKYEILDGQQRIATIRDFIDNKFKDVNDHFYKDLNENGKNDFKTYRVPAIILKSSLSKKEVSDIFIRMQEGSKLSNAEKVYALTGEFKNTFVHAFFDKNDNFFKKLSDKRFRARLIAAHFLTIELKCDFKNSFPNMSYADLKKLNSDTKTISNTTIRNYEKNIRYLGTYLSPMLKIMKIRELTPAYMLISYFNKKKVISKKYHGLIFKKFMMDFIKDLERFSYYDQDPPPGMNVQLFKTLQRYKIYSKQTLSGSALKELFRLISIEYKRRVSEFQYKDKKRLFTREQKMKMYFKQDGLCTICNKNIDYDDERVDMHHIKKYARGGKTNLNNAMLVHKICHKKIESQK